MAPPTTTTAVSLPGFTPLMAVLAVLAAALLLRRR
jgi:PGF-CTERM protein